MTRWRSVEHRGDGRKVVADVSLNQSSFLYHYLPWEYAIAIFKNSRLRLSPVQSWQDPYERWWCDKIFGAGGKLVGVNAYGLCWTTSHFDEPAWRMNGFQRPTLVRIRCLVSALLGAAKRHDAAASIYLGRVSYRSEQELRGLARTTYEAKQVSHVASELLLSKRNAFRFENEIRLMWFDRGVVAPETFLPIRQGDICQVMISPHATHEECETIARRFEQLGVATKRSLLLASPKDAGPDA